MLGAAESSTQAWVVISLALIGAISAIGAAWAANTARASTRKLDVRNSAQHVGTSDKLDQVAQQQQWTVTQIAAIRQALLDHVLWEEGNHAAPGKYDQLQTQMNNLEYEMAMLTKRPPTTRP